MKTKVSHLELTQVLQTYKINTVMPRHLEKDKLAQQCKHDMLNKGRSISSINHWGIVFPQNGLSSLPAK